MATIRTAIQITDGMTPAFRSMNSALNMVLSSFEAVQRTSSHAIDTNSITAARAELARAEASFNQVEQEIQQAANAQERLNNNVNNGAAAAGGLMGKLKGMVLSLGTAFGVSKIIELSDSMTSTKARIDLMNDGLQTTEQLQQKIMKAANDSRTAYMDTAQVVGKLGILAGQSFSSSKEMVAFAELMNKQFKIGGASLQESTSAMYQLTQAMAAGKLQGDEFRSIMENAPLLAQAIAKYTGKSMGELKKMSSEGEITAAIIKNAMFASADETNKKFAQMPMTFAQVGTVLGNTMLQTFEPVIQGIGKGAQIIYDNWSTIEPIFWGLAAGVGAFAIMMGILHIAEWIAIADNRVLIMEMLANPFLWVALAIGVVVGMIYKWVQSVGGIKIAWMIASNVILTAWDNVQIGFMNGTNAVMTYVGNMKVKVLSELQSMVNGSIDLINAFILGVNNIPGVSIETVAKVTFASEAAMKNDAAISARNNNIALKEADAKWNAAQRQYEIRTAQENAASALSDNDSNNIAAIAANTGKSKDISDEELKYMRDLATMEVVNRFTTAEITVNQNNTFGDIHETADLDGVISYFSEGLRESMACSAEGV
jgi:tape measure domain-containing protein